MIAIMKPRRNATWMLILLAIAVIGGTLSLVLQSLGLHAGSDYLGTVVLLALTALLILHSKWQLGIAKAIAFFLLAGGLGLLFEIWGLRGGTFFGGRYVYNDSGPGFWGVPYFIPLYWAVFIYTAYSISNGCLVWSGRQKPHKGSSRLLSLVPVIVFDGLLNIVLDLILDPVEVRAHAWTWLTHGAYFGVPVGNFVGWFIVTVVVTALFRLYEYVDFVAPPAENYVLLIPLGGYSLLGVGLITSAVIYGMYAVAAIGTVFFAIVAAAGFGLYARHKRITA